jgi:1,2-diacylglycerol 3-beta-galactosyltransferase
VRAELSGKRWSNVDVHIRGFVSPMCEYMAAADCIITKAGPGTVMEAASQGLPVMLSGYLPPQEAGNVDCVVRGGFGAFSRKPTVIARTVCRWLVGACSVQPPARLPAAAGGSHQCACVRRRGEGMWTR